MKPTAAKTVSVQLIHRNHMPRSATYLLSLLLACSATCAQATTYYWKGGSSWADYGTLSNWSTESAEGVDADALPGSGDVVNLQSCFFDMGGSEYTLGSKTEGSGSGSHNFSVSNGVLHIATKASSQNTAAEVLNGGNLIIDAGAILELGLWNGGVAKFNVSNGGALRIDGRLDLWNGDVRIATGGTFVLNGKARYSGDNNARTARIYNQGGSVVITNGFANTTSANAKTPVTLRQTSGTLTLGGDVDAGSYATTFDVSGGSIHVVSDCAVKATTATLSGTGLAIEIDDGATFDISRAAIASGTTITKTGAGDFDYMIGNMPDSLSVNEGALALKTANATYDISAVTFAANTLLKIGASGIVLSAFDSSLANATFAVADGFTPASGATVLTCSDATILAQARTGLNASLAGTGVSVEISGTSLVAESHYTFSSASVTDLNDTAGWVGGIAAIAGQPATISGASTAAVMDGTVPAYSDISIEDGASLTVTATRNLPATTLAAGTALAVASSAETVVMEDRSYSGYIMDTDTLVGTMSPSRSLSEITDIVGIRGGGWFGDRSNPYTYVNVKVVDDGVRLHVQFIYNDSDYTKCAFVDFTKDAQGNIYAIGTGAGHISPTSDQVDFDNIEYKHDPYGTSNTSGAYGVKNLTFKAPVVYGGDSTVTAVGDFVTTGSGSVTVDVATDCVLDLSGVDVTTAATLVKTGDGAIIFGDELPTALNVTEGVLVLQPYVEYDMGSITVADGVETKVLVGGEYKDAVAFVQQNGNTVFMSSGVYVGEGTWATSANWVNSEIPDASTAVHVHGANTVLTLDDGGTTMPASISVEAGATLRILAGVTLPPLAIDSTSKVVFGDNETTVSAVLDASLTTTANAAVSPVALPVFEITTNATVTIGGDMKFKNIDFRLYGKISKSSTGVKGPTFGYAANGETSYMAFMSDGGNFDIHAATEGDPSLGQINFLCPESGGTVVAVDTITLRNSTHWINGWNDMGDVRFGSHNPTTEVFNVLVDNTPLEISGQFYASGAAHIALINGSYIRRNGSCLGHGWNMAIQGAATVDVGEGCYINFATGGGQFGIDSQSSVDSVTVRTGGIYSVTKNSDGGRRGVFASDDGVLGVHRIYDSRTRTDLLLGFASARLDGELTIKSVDIYTGGGHYTSNDRHAKMANIPFSGTGDVVVTNGVPADPFTVTMVNGENTATGSIRVDKVEGDAETALYFADGANWAGTVVAGNVSLTNLTDGAAAANVDFGMLDLVGNFPIRVWTDSEGSIETNDMLKVGTYVNNGGRLAPISAADGEAFTAAGRIIVGKIGKDSPLPTAARGWSVRTSEILGDDANLLLTLKPSSGLQVILR